ncbi:MAG: hypothetical protein R2684_09000 [Pyrinomonadaceae bacterium]
MTNVRFLTKEELEAGIGFLTESPLDRGPLMMIVRRPLEDAREVLESGELDIEVGLVGDNWKTRGSSRTTDGFGHPDMQINIMNSRVVDFISDGDKARWPLAGDQLFVDLNLGKANLPVGTRIRVGNAELEVTAIPHTGCKKFNERFGVEATRFVNSTIGKEYCFRGINAKVVKSGTVSTGDMVEVLNRGEVEIL